MEEIAAYMKLIFATNNQHKIDEVRSAIEVQNILEIITLREAGIEIEIPEPYSTLEENASHKSRTVYALTRASGLAIGCFSEDTGLEVQALNGEPGVKSARYAGEDKSFDKNIGKLLHKLQGSSNREARFRAVISLIIEDKEHLFEGVCPGRIIDHRRGGEGFGYDPVFVPDGAIHTFAEMDMTDKNRFSHRKKAIDKLVGYLSKEVLA